MKTNAMIHQLRQATPAVLMAVAFVACLAIPDLALAQDRDFEGKTCGFLDNVTSLLGVASIAVVTIAIIFAGYQIAFAHKRISDVAPIVIGALLIGGAAQLAGWILGDDYGNCDASASLMQQALHYYS